MNIYSTVDGNNIDKIIVLFNSVYENSNNKNDLNFYLLTDKIPDTLPFIPDYLNKKLQIKELFLDEEWNKILIDFNKYFYKSAVWCKNNMNFSRFLFFKHFTEVKRVVYLDWDMIVQGNIFELEPFYNQLDKMVVCNCSNENIFNNIISREFKYASNITGIYDRKNSIKYHRIKNILKDLNISQKEFFNIKGFNAGFYILSNIHFDETYMKKLLNKLISIQKNFSCFNFGTQVVMNLMHLNNRVIIDKKWNHLPNIEDLREIKIIHWNGKFKPWNSVSPNNKIWYQYCEKIYPDDVEKYKLLKKFNKNIPVEEIKEIDKKESLKNKYLLKKTAKKNNNFLKLLISK